MNYNEIFQLSLKQRQPTNDFTVISRREKHGLQPDASQEDIAPIALKLLGNRDTALEAIELILGGRINTNERSSLSLLGSAFLVNVPAERRLAVMQKAVFIKNNS